MNNSEIKRVVRQGGLTVHYPCGVYDTPDGQIIEHDDEEPWVKMTDPNGKLGDEIHGAIFKFGKKLHFMVVIKEMTTLG